MVTGRKITKKILNWVSQVPRNVPARSSYDNFQIKKTFLRSTTIFVNAPFKPIDPKHYKTQKKSNLINKDIKHSFENALFIASKSRIHKKIKKISDFMIGGILFIRFKIRRISGVIY